MKQNVKERFFHGCNDCRDCCNGKLFSLGKVTVSDFASISKLFPTVINIKTREMLFFYSLVPGIGCHYLRDNNCSVYNIVDRPNTCLNFPFGIEEDSTIISDSEHCDSLNRDESDFPTLIDGMINTRVMNEFFTEKQYMDTLAKKDERLKLFVDLLIDSDSLLNFPKIKTTKGEVIDINEIESNRDMKVINIEKIKAILSRQNNTIYDDLIFLHTLSLENLPQFGSRVLEII